MSSDAQRMIYAIRIDRLDRLRELLIKTPDVSARSPGGRTALHAAAEEGNAEAAGLMLDVGVPVDLRTPAGDTPLHIAASYGHSWDTTDMDLDRRGPMRSHKPSPTHPRVAQALLDILRERDPRIPTGINLNDEMPAELKFSVAVEMLSLLSEGEAVRARLKAAGVDVDILDPRFSQTLQGHPRYLATSTLLLDCGADIDAADASGKTPLHRAVEYGRAPMARLLLARGATASLQRDPEIPYSQSLMGIALDQGKLETAKVLHEYGAELQFDEGRPLHHAVEMRQKDLLLWLLERGAPIDGVDNMGNTALLCAAQNAETEIMEILRQHGADLGRKNLNGQGVLHLGSQNLGALQFLLSLGLNPGESDNDGWTPLHHAALSLSAENARLLLAAGASPNAQNKDGNTPLQEIFFGDEPRPDIEFPVMHCLVAAGCDCALKNNAGKSVFELANEFAYPDEYIQLLDPAVAGPNHAARFIWIGEPEYDAFSTQAQIPVEIDSRKWLSSFHYFHAQKFKGTPPEEQIRAASSIEEVWKTVHENKIRRSWSPLDTMHVALMARFQQHDALRAKLLATGSTVLVDYSISANPADKRTAAFCWIA